MAGLPQGVEWPVAVMAAGEEGTMAAGLCVICGQQQQWETAETSEREGERPMDLMATGLRWGLLLIEVKEAGGPMVGPTGGG
jgi:hypothetical protein